MGRIGEGRSNERGEVAMEGVLPVRSARQCCEGTGNRGE